MKKSTIMSVLLTTGLTVSADNVIIAGKVPKDLPKELQNENKLNELIDLWQKIDLLEQEVKYKKNKELTTIKEKIFCDVCKIIGISDDGYVRPHQYLSDKIKVSYGSKFILFLIANRLKHLGSDFMPMTRCAVFIEDFTRDIFNKLEVQIDALRKLKEDKIISDMQLSWKLIELRKKTSNALYTVYVKNLLDNNLGRFIPYDSGMIQADLNKIFELYKADEKVKKDILVEIEKYKKVENKIKDLLEVLQK